MEMAPLAWIEHYLPALLLAMCRTSGFFIISPLISRKGVPNMAKVGLCLLMSIIIIQMVPISEVPQFEDLGFVLLCVKELGAGWVMGCLPWWDQWDRYGPGKHTKLYIKT